MEGLAAKGYKLPSGPICPGLGILIIHRAGGYYVDIGAADMIATGKIKIKHGQDITGFTQNSLQFADGEELQADEVVFATGYENARTRTRTIFGEKVADKIDPIWGFTEQGEIRGCWRRSGHPGFWVGVGGFWLSRYCSKLLALQIKAVEEGLVAL